MIGPFLWLDGLPGAGKTRVTKHVAKAFGYSPYFEPVESNPFLTAFYQDPGKYAFGMQMWMLHMRYLLQRTAEGEALRGRGVVMDRGIPGDRVFCRVHIQEGNIYPELWHVYELAFNVMTTELLSPALLVYLDVTPETALRRVRGRGRECEEDGITLDYLQKLQAGYEELLDEINSGRLWWTRGMKVCRYDWNEDYQPMEQLLATIKEYLSTISDSWRL